jgi:hypothetical protein
MGELDEFESRLRELLREAGCVRYGVPDLIADTKQCRDEIYSDTVAHGGSVSSPFFDFVIVEGVAVFTFFESDFSVYVFACNELELINVTGALAMTDTDACKLLLEKKYGKPKPDLVIARGLVEHWLSS